MKYCKCIWNAVQVNKFLVTTEQPRNASNTRSVTAVHANKLGFPEFLCTPEKHNKILPHKCVLWSISWQCLYSYSFYSRSFWALPWFHLPTCHRSPLLTQSSLWTALINVMTTMGLGHIFNYWVTAMKFHTFWILGPVVQRRIQNKQ